MVEEILSLIFIFNFTANPYVGLTIVSLTIYTTYFLFHKKKILKRFYHETPEGPRNDKKYYTIVFISMIALLFIINLIATILSLIVGFAMFIDSLVTFFGSRPE